MSNFTLPATIVAKLAPMSKTQKIDEANRWLSKAIEYADAGKSAAIVESAFKYACAIEDVAFAQ